MKKTSKYLYLILFSVGFVFLKGGYSKLTADNYILSLPGSIEMLALQNPYPFFKSILINTAIPNYFIIGNLAMWGELLIGLTITSLSAFFVLSREATKKVYLVLLSGLMLGFLFSLIFYLTASWTSPSIENLNFLMMTIQAFGVAYVYNSIKALK